MEQPQSDAEIRPVQEKLRELDAGLRIVWNPMAKVTRPNGYDVYGLPFPPTYEGRWEVRKVGNDGVDACVYQVCWDGDRQMAYRPVGWWLVEFFQKWDMAQRHAIREWEKAWAEDEKAKTDQLLLSAEADAERLLERIANELHGETLVSVGADLT